MKERRSRLDPAQFGFSTSRRRTPGLRREEVAQLADLSATWYTWLERGRGGTPSVDVLERLSTALQLNGSEREYLFLIAQHRPPEVRTGEMRSGTLRSGETPDEEDAEIAPRFQTILDALGELPAYIRNASWDMLAWNRAAAKVFMDYGSLAPEERNILRQMFCNPDRRLKVDQWEEHARMSVATLRAESARAGTPDRVRALVQELSEATPDFRELWQAQEVGSEARGRKRMIHAQAGELAIEYSSLKLSEQGDLTMVIFTPADEQTRDRISALLRSA